MYQNSSAQVQGTNDACTLSKCSTVSKKYYEDEFVAEFVSKKKTRASLIHLGYYTRAVIFNKLIKEYIEFLKNLNITKFQIISCGCGFDTLFWRIVESKLLNESSSVIEIDFPDVINKKVSMIKQSPKLKSFLKIEGKMFDGGGIHQMSSNPFYYLFGMSLCDVGSIGKKLNEIGVDFAVPTLFLSECAVTYMKREESDKLINWMAVNFKNGVFVNYEQIHPNDGFGVVMMRHFNKFQSSLYSVNDYPTVDSHIERYKTLGFQKSSAISEMDLFLKLFTRSEFLSALSLELFDEFEELFLKCVHYVIAVAGNGVSSKWIDFSTQTHPNQTNQRELGKEFSWEGTRTELNLFRHTTSSNRKSIFVFGGCNYTSRSKVVYQLNANNLSDFQVMEVEDDGDIQLDIVHGTVIYFEINETRYFCVYGGRNAPDKICNEGAAVVFELQKNKLVQKLKTEKNPIPRYRSKIVSLPVGENAVSCYIFGGRTDNLRVSLEDLWEVTFVQDENKNLLYEWKSVECSGDCKPAGRFSHSLVTSIPEKALYLSGGINLNCLNVFGDVWKWSQETRTWTCMIQNLLPRYGHTSHLIDGKLYLIGGVNMFNGKQPEIAVVDLKTRKCTEYTFKELNLTPVLLFNHSSEVIDDGESKSIVVVGGGGSCFSFGTYVNEEIIQIKLDQLNTSLTTQ